MVLACGVVVAPAAEAIDIATAATYICLAAYVAAPNDDGYDDIYGGYGDDMVDMMIWWICVDYMVVNMMMDMVMGMMMGIVMGMVIDEYTIR